MIYRKLIFYFGFFICSSLICFLAILFSCEKSEQTKLTVTTEPATFITQTSCIVKGNIVEIGEGKIIQYGHCWSVIENPSTTDSKTQKGSKNSFGIFVSVLTGLNANTTYHVRAYAVDDEGPTYGNEISFTTLLFAVPTVTTSSVSNITNNSAICGGEIIHNGGATVTARGVCWSTNQNPTIADWYTTDGNGPGSFTSKLTGLTGNTTYYVRAYATNRIGTAYGDQQNFSTDPATVTDIDGNVYNLVRIGTQLWMKENLNTTSYNDSTDIPLVTDNTEWRNMTTPGYCWYNNDKATYKETYGALYNWYTVNTGKLCSKGWHVPSNADWIILTNFLGGANVAGYKLKETGTTHWNGPNAEATNSSGFTALPGGWRDKDGFWGLGTNASFWSSTEDNVDWAWSRYLGRLEVYAGEGNKQNGFSVRCVRD